VKVTIGSTVVSNTEQWETDELAAIECVQRAWQGEVGQGTMIVPDSPGTLEIYAGQRVKLEDGPTTFLDGFAGAVSTVRGNRLRPARIHRVTWIDRNALLDGFRTTFPRWFRPAEAARTRILALNTDYLGGMDTTYVVNTGPVTLLAKSYVTDDLVQEVLADINVYINKTLFVVGNELHFHWPTEGETSMFVVDDTVGETQAITGTTKAAAEEKANANGAYQGSPVAGHVGPAPTESTAVLFDGADDVVYRGSPIQTVVNNFTIEAWLYPSLPQNTTIAFYVGTDAGGYGLGVGDGAGGSGSKLVGLYGTVAHIDSGYTFPAANVWYHVILERDAGTTKFWVNGVQTANTSAAVPLAPVLWTTIGAERNAGNTAFARFYAGRAGLVAAYNGILSGADKTDHYERALGLRSGQSYVQKVLSSASLQALWTLGDRYRRMPAEPTRDKDPLDLRNDVRGVNKAGLAYTITDPASIARHNAGGLRHQGLIVTDTASGYIGAAKRALSEGRFERVTYAAKLTGFTPAQAAYLKPGQLIAVTSQLDSLTDRGTRIAQLTWLPQPSGLYDAVLDLEYPRRQVRRR
jgi:concanavalin A-like lectin/glucanase superfamily protein